MAHQVLDSRRVSETASLPPGYRFHPTDEELVSNYLIEKVMNPNADFQAIGEVDFNKCEPWDLPARAKSRENTIYFFTLRDRKYPTGMRTNRATEKGYWKATGKDRSVFNRTRRLVGAKKTLVFYTGRAPKGEKTSWVMHEYRLEGDSTQLTSNHQQWVVCRIFQKRTSIKPLAHLDSDNTSDNTEYSSLLPSSSLPALQSVEPLSPNSAGLSNVYADLVAPSGPQGYLQGAPILGPEPILLKSNSARVGRESHLGDTLENLLAGWEDMCDFLWDSGARP